MKEMPKRVWLRRPKEDETRTNANVIGWQDYRGWEDETLYIRADLVPAWQPIETATALMRDTQWAIVETTEGMEVGWWSAGQNCFLASPGAPLWGDAIKYFAVPPRD